MGCLVKKIRFRAIFLFIFVVFVCFFSSFRNKNIASVESENLSTTPFLQIRSELQEKTATKKNEIIGKLRQMENSNEYDLKTDNNSYAVLQTAFSGLYENINFFDTENLEKSVFEELSNNSTNAGISRDILLDSQSTLDLFGEKEAEIRTYALKFLSFEAMKGNSEPLFKVISGLKDALSLKGESVKGQYLDLEDSVLALCQSVQGKKQISRIREIINHFQVIEKPSMTPPEKEVLLAFVRGIALCTEGGEQASEVREYLIKEFPISLMKG